MRRISNSWALAKSSWSVLKSDKELAAIPLMSFVVTLVVMAAVGGGVYVSLRETDTVTSTGAASDSSLQATPLTYAVGVVGYLLVTFVVTYFAAVLVSGAHQRLTGHDPTLGSAFGRASSRLGPIAAWSLLTGTVGLVLQAVRQRAGFLGNIVVSLVGAAWEVVTWLAVPVVVVEGTGPIVSLKRSASLFKQTWGENLIAQAGFGILGFVLVIPALLVAAAIGIAIPVIGVAVAVLWIALVAVVMSALSGIYRAALYLYASGEQIPPPFTQQELSGAFVPKGRRR